MHLKCEWVFIKRLACKHPSALEGASTHFIQHAYCDCACLLGPHSVHVRVHEFAQTDVSVPCVADVQLNTDRSPAAFFRCLLSTCTSVPPKLSVPFRFEYVYYFFHFLSPLLIATVIVLDFAIKIIWWDVRLDTL